MTDLTQLRRRLGERQVIAFVGAGVSAGYTDEHGKSIPGLPTAQGLVDLMALEKPDLIEKTMPFEEAAFLYKKNESPTALIGLLTRELGRDIPPFPTHKLIAALPFAGFVSMNFDTLLEKALTERHVPFRTIIADNDVGLTSDQSNELVVLKPHGCLTRRESLIASADTILPLATRSPLIDAYLRVLLANKTILFLGFGLGDYDFRFLVQDLRSRVSPLPKSYAVARSVGIFRQQFWQAHEIETVDTDLTEFLRDTYEHFVSDGPGASAAVLTDPLFQGIPGVLRLLPTETQAINAFLEQIHGRLSAGLLSLKQINELGERASKSVLDKKPNFHAFRRVAELVNNVLTTSLDIVAADTALANLTHTRRNVSALFNKVGRDRVTKPLRILLYSQSLRVVQFLEGVVGNIFQQCELYIAECRPKSPSDFADALTYSAYFSDRRAKVTIMPDAAIWHLFYQDQIDIVLMGAHEIIEESGVKTGFVNTCGSGAVADFCDKFGKELWVIAEEEKVASVTGAPPPISFAEEVTLLDPNSGLSLPSLWKGPAPTILNVGYDYVSANRKTIFITENG